MTIPWETAGCDMTVLSGTPDGRGGWAVDDGVSINGQIVSWGSGPVANPQYTKGDPITTYKKLTPPLDVTESVAGAGSLTIELGDLGGLYGSTELYLVRVSLPCAARNRADVAECTSEEGLPSVQVENGNASCEAADGATATAIAKNGGTAYAGGDGPGTSSKAMADGEGAQAQIWGVGSGNTLRATARGTSAHAVIEVTGNDNSAIAMARGDYEFARVMICNGVSGQVERAFNSDIMYPDC